MNFDFNSLYKNYTTSELLKITRQPEAYQPEALEAARQLLLQRDISAADTEAADAYFEDARTDAKRKNDQLNAYRDAVGNVLQPVLRPGTEVTASGWLKVLLLFLALQYIYMLFLNITHIVQFFHWVNQCSVNSFDTSFHEASGFWECFNNEFNFSLLIDIATLIYIPVIFYLLYKRKRWGWILLFADTLGSFIFVVSQSYIFFAYQRFHHGSSISFIISVVVKAAFAFFLWKDDISGYFAVSRQTKLQTAIVVALLAVLLVAGAQLFI